MKKSIFTLFLLLLVTNFVSAQKELSKAEKKQIKKTLKEYRKHPEQYKTMVNEYKTTIDSNEIEINEFRKNFLYLNTKKENLEKELASVKADLEECKNRPLPQPEDAAKMPATGTFYKVQFGLYEKLDISNYFTPAKYMTVEKVEGYNRYVLGFFTTEAEAEAFVADMRKMGIKDAFVAKYTDGQRIMEWEKNPKFKGKTPPASLKDAVAPVE